MWDNKDSVEERKPECIQPLTTTCVLWFYFFTYHISIYI